MSAISFDSTAATQPRVSIVVAANGCREAIDVLVDVVLRHPRRESLEVVVVSAGTHRGGSDKTLDQPFVRHVAAPICAAPGELRANGIRHASGDVVILLDGDQPIDALFVDSLLTPAIRVDD